MSTRDGNGPGPQESEHTDGRGPGPLRGHGAAGRSPRHDNGQTPQADEHTDGEDPGRPLHSHGTAAGSPRHDNGQTPQADEHTDGEDPGRPLHSHGTAAGSPRHDNGQAPPDNGHVGARGPDRPRTDHGSARGSAQNRSGRAPRTGEHTDVGHPDRPCTDPGGAGRRSARDEDGQAPQESEHTGACGPDRRRTDDGGTGLKPRSKPGRGPQRGGRARVGGPDRLRHRAVRFLRARPRVLLRLAGWSVLEAAQTFLLGYALARALDDGFLAGRAGVGLGWLAAAGVGVLVGAYGTGRVYRAVAALVEPLRDRLVTRVVERGVREGDGGALSGLTQQVEIARDTFAGLVMVSRSFLFTSAGALVGLFSLAPALLLVVLPPLAAGVGLFAATLRPLARRQEVFLAADEFLASGLGAVCPGLRDVTAAGAEEQIAADLGELADAELRAARSLARWGVARVACLAVGGHLPVVLLLAAAPWLLAHGTTPGALAGALAYVTQSLLPALDNLIHGLGTSGSRLTVVLRRLSPPPAPAAVPPSTAGREAVGHPRPTETSHPPGNAPHRPPAPAPRTIASSLRTGTDGQKTGRPPRPTDTAHPSAGAHHRPPTPAPRTVPAPPDPADLPPSTDGRQQTGPPRPTDTPHPPPDGHHRPATPGKHALPSSPALSLTSVTFAYGPASAPVVDGLSLGLPVGGHLAVVGPSGSGKSTLAGLVAGVLKPWRGEVRVWGRPVSEATAWRVLIPQEAYVFGGTLAENLGYLRADPVPEAELLAAAEAVGLAPLLDGLGGPAAVVDPAALSAGERQLIALTRAYLSHAPLALLDDATCHLDPEAEERAERAFAGRPGGTLVVVAHRISSARRAGQVLVMEGPRTVCGTHAEVLRRSPLYRELVGRWEPSSQPALPLRDTDGVDPVAGPGLAGDGRHVVAHGPVGQVQAPGDLRDRGALGREG